MWRLQNDMTPISRLTAKKDDSNDDQPSFTEITLDVRPDESTRSGLLTKY
jgi:twitching motility protein PilU